MTVTVKGKAPLVVPPSALRKAGIRAGDKLKFETTCSGVITIEKEFEDAADEYTPAQRKIIDAEIEAALLELKRGEFYSFNSVDEMSAFLNKRRAEKRVKAKRKR